MLNLNNHLNSILTNASITEINFSFDPHFGLYLNVPWLNSKSNIEAKPYCQWTSLEEFMSLAEDRDAIAGQYVCFKGEEHFIPYQNYSRKHIYAEILICKYNSDNMLYIDLPGRFAWEKVSKKSFLFLNLLAECSSIEELELKLGIIGY